MKWFKHEVKRKASLKKIIMEFGIEGYGIYWLCVELIAGDITIDNLSFELEEDASLIGHEFNVDTLKVEKVMHKCIELGLFDLADSGNIRCLHLAKMLDESISKNAQVKHMKKKIAEKLAKNGNSGEIPESIPIPSSPDKIRLDKIRLDKIREEKKTYSENQDFLYIINIWNNNNLTKHNLRTLEREIKKKHIDTINHYGTKEIECAINNYSKIVNNKESYFNHKYTLWDFLSRGYTKFLNECEPETNFIINTKKGDEQYTESTNEICKRLGYAR